MDSDFSNLNGDGAINANGLVADMDLTFDADHGTNQVFSFGAGGTLNLNLNGTGDLGAGFNGTGTLRIADGVKVASNNGYVGYNSGSTGTAIITGPGSTWTSSYLYVGGFPEPVTTAASTLTVENGGTVTTNTLSALQGALKGDGTINAKGLVSDMNLVFDAAHGASQVLPFGAGGTLNLNPDATGDLGIGVGGKGTLRIADGVKIASFSGEVGFGAGYSGTATVTGTGST